jgi:hypothetical protein
MAAFAMTCTCGDEMSVEAADRDQAVSMLQAGMTQEGLDAHWSAHHAGDPQKPSLEQLRGMIGQLVAAR